MKLMDKLFNNKGYIDGITIINLKGEILFTAKFNNKLNKENIEPYEVVGENFLEVYENLTEESSTTYKAMTLGLPIYKENQTLKSKGRRKINISSLSIPIKSGNSIVGAIDLSLNDDLDSNSKDIEVDTLKLVDNSIDRFNLEYFQKNNIENLNNNGYQAKYTADNIVTNDKKMIELKEYIDIAASCNLPTLIYGETGTGKELFAQAIHNKSNRKNKPFVSQNCAAIPENLLESILFGTSKGAFTGAVDNTGLLEIANGGTVLLDEINSMPLHLQSKLLRVLEEGIIRKVGSMDAISIDVKIIAAINEEPLKAIEGGNLRKDIYYRLSSLNINIPPLRERQDDIPLLLNFMVLKYNKVFKKNIKYISKNLVKKINSYDWPGNIRELENVIIYGLSMVNENKEKLQYEDISFKMEELIKTDKKIQPNKDIEIRPLRNMINDYEKSIIENILNKTNFNVTKASKILSIPRQTLHRKAQNYKLI